MAGGAANTAIVELIMLPISLSLVEVGVCKIGHSCGVAGGVLDKAIRCAVGGHHIIDGPLVYKMGKEVDGH